MKRHRRRVLVGTTGITAVIALVVSTALIVGRPWQRTLWG